MEILEKIIQMYPDAKCELTYQNSFEFLIKVILSAQTTDKAVNYHTKELFEIYDTPEKMLKLTYDELYNEIKVLGLAKNKTNYILNLSKILVEKYDSKIPTDKKILETLPGVGKKTANVYLAEILKVPAIAVDTHVYRVSKRIGLVDENATVEECEESLEKRYPKDLWIKAHHSILFLGRYKCKAKNPECESCLIKEKCRFFQKQC